MPKKKYRIPTRIRRSRGTYVQRNKNTWIMFQLQQILLSSGTNVVLIATAIIMNEIRLICAEKRWDTHEVHKVTDRSILVLDSTIID